MLYAVEKEETHPSTKETFTKKKKKKKGSGRSGSAILLSGGGDSEYHFHIGYTAR